jgi:hypothetical protein
MKFFVLSLLWLSIASTVLANGLIVYKNAAGVQFAEAISLKVNDKDKVLSLGPEAVISGPVNKLAQVRIAGILLNAGGPGVIGLYTPGQPLQYSLPQGLAKNTSTTAAEAWKDAELAYRKSKDDKAPATVSAAEFLAYLPEGVPELATLCRDNEALAILGGKAGAFPIQIELLSAAVAAYGTNPEMVQVESYVRQTMQNNLDRFDSGLESLKSLEQGLQFSRLSSKAYATLPEHQKLRATLSERKEWLDRRMSILLALSAGREPDAFLLAFRDFEKHQLSFPNVMKLQNSALRDSLKVHYDSGKERLADREYQAAWRELKFAGQRQPGHSGLQKDLAVAWAEYSRSVAVDRRSARKQLTMGQQEAITQSLHFASRYKEQGKLDEALKSVMEAEAIDGDHLAVLLKKAEILGARLELSKAIMALDQYDMHAVDDERSAGNKLRNEFAFLLTTSLREQKSKIEAAWTGNRFHLTAKLAADTLRSDERDPDVLYYAGISAYVTRNRLQAREYLQRFLDTSNTVDSNAERRNLVFRLLRGIDAQRPKPIEQGEPNWFSAAKLPPDVVYDPMSLAFGPRVERIAASHKMSLHYTWDGNRLTTIAPAFEKPADATGEKTVTFTYAAAVPHVLAVQTEGGEALKSQDPDELLKQASVILLNNTLIDPLALEQLTGKQVTVMVTGNRFFHPFIWQNLHYFYLSYDANSRVKSAREIPGQNTPKGSEVTVYFDWDSLHLNRIRAYQNGIKVYERDQVYQSGHITSEEIHTGGKTSYIKYVYKGAVLVSAECDKDETIDNRSREVFFTSAVVRKGK